MTSRRKTKKNTNESTDMKTSRKRGRSDGSPTSSAAAVTPPETGRGQRRNLTQTSPSQVSPELPLRKSRRGTTTPETPQRTSPRGRGGGSPVTKESPLVPRGRGRRRRGSTDSSASSVGTASVASSSTPTQRRGRRGSSSSGVSAASENSQVTPPTRQTGRGRKRNKSNSPPVSKKTNGASPQYSPRNTKRRRGTPQVGTSSPAANGRNGRRTRGRGGVSETPPQEDLDGGTDDEESSHLEDSKNSIVQNSSDSLELAEHETPELPIDTSHSTNDVGEEDDEFRKSEICRNLADTYDNDIDEDHTLHRSEEEQNAEKESNLCKNKHTDDEIPIPDSEKTQHDTIPVAVCVNEHDKNDEDTGVSVPDSEKEHSGKRCGTNIPVSGSENKFCEKQEGASIAEVDLKLKEASVPESDIENKPHERHEGTDTPESHSVSEHHERHEGTNILLLDNKNESSGNKNESSGKHQGINIPVLECESGHSKQHVDTNSPISKRENNMSETRQKSNSPVSKSENTCSVGHEDANISLTNSIPAKLKEKAESQLCTSSDAQLRTCDSDKCKVSDLSATTSSPTNSSSRVQSAKRRQTSGECSDSESPEVKPKAPKIAKLSDSVPDVTNSFAGESSRDSVLEKYERSKETDKSDLDRGKCKGSKEVDVSKSLSHVKEVKVEEEMDSVTKAETFLESLVLTEEQSREVCSVLPADVRDSSEAKIVEVLVETLLNGSTTVTTMNAPRFNKLLRQLLTHYCNLETTKENKHALCEKAVKWAHDRKSVNLRHELELTLMSLYYSTCHYKQAEVIASGLYSETKKLQDKEKTVKACLCLSQVYHAMGNISKARANITTAKTEALKIYTPPDMQGELDLQSGIMQVAEGKDMETAYSYFKEAATGFTSRRQRSRALKYMLLSKIMVNRAEEGEKAVRSQSHIHDIDEGVEAMLAITSAANRSSLADFRKTRELYKEQLGGDMVVASVLDDLYITMMEKNLLNIILPYERLQIVHVADRIGLPREEVERRLSQMILDKRINAQLDHRDDCLYVYAAEDSDVVYQKGIDILSQLDKTVSHLNRKVKKLL